MVKRIEREFAHTKGNARGSGYDREKDDWYVESADSVRALLRAELFYGKIWDPACGGGNIPRVCREFGYDTVASDLVDRGYGLTGHDFMETEVDCDNVVSNPPYAILEKFVLRAISKAHHKVAVLVRLAWLEGTGRHSRLFDPHPPARVLIFSNRISVPPGGTDIEAKGGAVAYAWIVWSTDHRGPTQLDWIRA